MRSILTFIGLIFISSCSHQSVLKSYDELEALKIVCSIGTKVKSLDGDVMMKIDSKEAKGQFPAFVKMPSADHLQVEVSNFIGQTEVLIDVNQERYSVRFPRKSAQDTAGTKSWGGDTFGLGAIAIFGKNSLSYRRAAKNGCCD